MGTPLSEFNRAGIVLKDGKELVKSSKLLTKKSGVKKTPTINSFNLILDVREDTPVKVFIKPLSVNQVWKGKRFKTKEYVAYSRNLAYLLPNDAFIPEGLLIANYEFGLSSMGGDWDNPVKPLQDILSKKYGFNDNRIRRAIVDLVPVEKGNEYVKFHFEKL